MKKIILLILIISLFSGCVKKEESRCTLEAKVCPDGSSVGRVPPDCEFAPCPQVEAADEITDSISDVDTVDDNLDNEEIDTDLDNLEEDLSNW